MSVVSKGYADMPWATIYHALHQREANLRAQQESRLQLLRQWERNPYSVNLATGESMQQGWGR